MQLPALMGHVERIREEPANAWDPDYRAQRLNAGWRLVAVEWERPVESKPAGASIVLREELPFGVRIADDCKHLEEDPTERQVLMIVMEAIVQDRNLSDAAIDLNTRGYRTRQGTLWGPAGVFALLPRLIEVGPRIFSTGEWAARRSRLLQRT